MRRWIFPAILLLCGCTPALQQKVNQTQLDQATYAAQSREREAAQRCNQTMPGTTAHLACRLGNAAPK